MSKKLRKLKSLCKGTEKEKCEIYINRDNVYLYSESMIKKKDIWKKKKWDLEVVKVGCGNCWKIGTEPELGAKGAALQEIEAAP